MEIWSSNSELLRFCRQSSSTGRSFYRRSSPESGSPSRAAAFRLFRRASPRTAFSQRPSPLTTGRRRSTRSPILSRMDIGRLPFSARAAHSPPRFAGRRAIARQCSTLGCSLTRRTSLKRASAFMRVCGPPNVCCKAEKLCRMRYSVFLIPRQSVRCARLPKREFVYRTIFR